MLDSRAQNDLWKEAVSLLSHNSLPSKTPSVGARKTLFGEESPVDTVCKAVARCAQRGSPFCLWRIAKEGGTEAGAEFLEQSEKTIALLPSHWRAHFSMKELPDCLHVAATMDGLGGFLFPVLFFFLTKQKK
jgi:hypothetical protein